MTVYTSYFGISKKFPRDKFIRTAVCYKVPAGIGIWNNVVPDADLVYGLKRGEITKEYYEQKYLEMLESRKQWIAENIPYMKNSEKDIVLLCYEKSDEWCHRHILAKFLNDNFDLNVTEYKFEDKKNGK